MPPPTSRNSGSRKSSRWYPYMGLYRSWLAKAPGFVLRMAGLLTFMEWAEKRLTTYAPETIGFDVIERAILFVDHYLTPMAERFLGEAYKLSEEEISAAMIAKFIKGGKSSHGLMCARDIMRARLSKRLSGAEVIKDGLDVLIAANWVRAIPERTRGGNPRGDYEVNPMVYAAAPLPVENTKSLEVSPENFDPADDPF